MRHCQFLQLPAASLRVARSWAIVVARVEQRLLEESVLRGWLEGAVTREEDRALFGLRANFGVTTPIASK
jgi:hypothetical protein